MATFKVKLGSSEGEVAVRLAQGRSSEEVHRLFQREGFHVFSVTRTFAVSDWLGFQQRISLKKFITFNKEFRGLLRAGLPIVEGFDILLKRMKDGRLRQLLAQVREKLTKGESLSQAFQNAGGGIPRYYPALLHAGEQSGALVEVLDRFIEQEDRIRLTRKRFLQTLTYPAILLVVAMISLYLILSRAMPEFAALYEGADKELPAVTQIVIGLSTWVVDYHRIGLIVIVALAVAAFFYLKSDTGRSWGERLLGRIPIVGGLWHLQNQNIFARTMRMMLTGGIPVPQALAITADAVPSHNFRRELLRAHVDVLQGSGLQASLSQHARLTDTAGEMIRVGEETGTLAEMLTYVAEIGEENAEDYLELVSNLVAPLVLLVVGLVIAFLVAAMYLPMFGSYDALGL